MKLFVKFRSVDSENEKVLHLARFVTNWLTNQPKEIFTS